MCTRYISPDSAAIERHWHIGRDDAWRGDELFPRSLGPFVRAARDATEAEQEPRDSMGDAAADAVRSEVATWAARLSVLGAFNFLLSDGERLFAHCSTRRRSRPGARVGYSPSTGRVCP